MIISNYTAITGDFFFFLNTAPFHDLHYHNAKYEKGAVFKIHLFGNRTIVVVNNG